MSGGNLKFALGIRPGDFQRKIFIPELVWKRYLVGGDGGDGDGGCEVRQRREHLIATQV